MKTLIIIPAYNESENIEHVINKVKMDASFADYLVVNDCSTDNTKEILESIGANYISLPYNLGIGGGVQAGYVYARENNYDIAIQLDGDGQHDSIYVRDLVMPIQNGCSDVVIGSRFIEKEGFQSSQLRRAGIRFLSSLIKLCCGVKISDVTSGYRAVNKKMIDIFADNYAQDYPEPEAVVSSVLHGARIAEIPVVMQERRGGISSISPLRSVYYMLKVSIGVILYRMTFNQKRMENG